MRSINLRHALRSLLKTPFVTTVAVLSLALGIGANAATFSLFYQAMIMPLPVPSPHELVNLTSPGPKPGSRSTSRIGDENSIFSFPMFRDLERVQDVFTGVAAHRGFAANLAYRGHTLSGYGVLVSGDYFPVLGIRPVLGRFIDRQDAATVGEGQVVVLAHDYWRLRFDAGQVIGDTLVVNGQPMTIIGVAPYRFEGTTVGAKPQVYVPITMAKRLQTFETFENRRAYWVYLFARLRSGVTMAAAQTAINVPYGAIVNEIEAPQQTGQSQQTMARFRAKQIELTDGSLGQSMVRGVVGPSGVLLLWVTGAVLLIACVNIANLLLSRAATRSSEMAIRLSVGCSRVQLVAQLMTESYLLAIAGAIGALVVARWTLVLIAQLIPPEALALLVVELDDRMLFVTGALALATGLLFGLVPAFQSTRPDLVSTLRNQAGQTAGSRVAGRVRVALATTQIALSMALLVAAGLVTRSLVNITRSDLGFEIDNVVTFRVSPAMNGYPPERSRALFERLEETIASLPGVTGVTSSRMPLLAGSASGREVRVQGFEAGPDTDRSSRYNVIGTDFFRTMGVRLIAGREFTPADTLGAPKVAIVNEAFASKFQLPPSTIIGTRMASDGSDTLDTEIVGLVANTKYAGVKNEMPPQFYLPYRQDDLIGAITFYARTSLDPDRLVGQLPAVVGGLDPSLPIEFLKSLPDQVSDNVFIDRGVSILAAIFAGLATLLAGIGLYGVLAYTVAQRTKEIGVRMAVGADAARVRRMILSQVAWMTVAGGTLGLSAAVMLGRWGRSVLYELEPYDPAALLTSVALLAVVALGAGFIPALRASKVDPIRALRYE